MKIEDSLFRVLDTETTGLDVETARIVELGACDVFDAALGVAGSGERGWIQTAAASWLCDPGLPIPAEAKAVHHILDDDVRGQPPASVRIPTILPVRDEAIVYVAHHAHYDRPILEAHGFPVGQRWLCTYRLAMHVWPEAPSYKNEVLRYWLGYDVLPWREVLLAPDAPAATHRAAHDVAVTALLLREALKAIASSPHDRERLSTVDALIAWAESPVLLKGVMGFGKHHDKTWAEVAQIDSGYLDWMIRQEDREPGAWDPDKLYTAMHYRGRLI
jgi:exodeoxyribonuclease X